MAETGGKKGKKKKGKTLNLVEFLTGDGTNKGSKPSLGPVYNTKSSSNWADESEDLSTEVDNRWPEESYGGAAKRQMSLAALPTAPRASMEVEIDYSKIPEQPPYTAFLGNLPYDVEKIDIMDFFREVQITEVRLPQDAGGGRPKGFGYAEFADRESLVQALSLNNETLRGRKLRIDIAGQNQGGGDRERSDRDEGPDLTMGNWRSGSSSDGDRSSRDDNRYERRDEGGWGRDSDRGSRYGDRDRQDGRDSSDPYAGQEFTRDQAQPPAIRGRDGRDSSDPYAGQEFTRDQAQPPAIRGRESRDSSDPYAGQEFTRDQAQPPAIRGASSQNGDSRNDSYGDRRNDSFGDRGDRGYGDRDNRGYGGRSDRGYGDRDRGYGDRDRSYGDRDRGYGNRDRGYGDRDRGYGERYRGYSDRGYGDRGYGDRGYGDRDRGYGDRDRGYGDRDRGYGDRGERDRHDYGGRGGQDEDPDSAKARPRLQLKPRSKPAEETKPAAPVESRKSIFGDAKPVDTTAKEREIEQKLEKLKAGTDLKKDEQKGEHDYRSQRDTSRSNEGEFRSRKDSGRSSEGESRSRKDSGRSGEGEFRSRKDSGRSSEGEKSVEKEGTAIDQERMQDKSVPPPPVVNVWKQRMDAQKTTVTSDKGKDDTSSESITRKLSSERTPEKKAVSPNGLTSPVGRGSNPRQQNRSERGGGTRGRGRGENQGRTIETGDERSKEERKDRREKKATEFKKCDDQPPVFHQDSKFSLLMDDEEANDDESAET